MEYFVLGSMARTAASLCGVNRIAGFFLRLREVIVGELTAGGEAMFGGAFEVDESYFGGHRKGKRVWGGTYICILRQQKRI